MAETQGRPYERKLKRHQVSKAVDVYDAVNNTHVGRLVNIHTEGLMLVSEEVFPHNNLYQLELRLPQAVNGRQTIPMGVDCLWSRAANESASDGGVMYWAGCKIIDISDEALADLQQLIDLIAE